jgi:hypothetical protein
MSHPFCGEVEKRPHYVELFKLIENNRQLVKGHL